MKKVVLFLCMTAASGSYAIAGEMINKQLPSSLKADIQLRYRLEAKDNFDFNDSHEDRDAIEATYWF